MCDLCSPCFPENKTYEELVKLVTEHFEPQRSEIAECHVFRLRRQRPGGSLTEYLQALKHLAATCNFGKCNTCSTLEENLRNQFVSGLANDAMRSRIFAEKKIQYKEAVELALALEAAEKHAEVSGSTKVLATDSGATGGEAGECLHYARGSGGFKGRQGGQRARPPRAPGAGGATTAAGAGARACWRCGRAHADRCRFKYYNCDECGQRGHIKAGNGAAENAGKTIKKTIKRALYEGEDINAALNKFLLKYRNCEHATTGVSPAVALQGRRLRSRLDALRPDVVAAVRSRQEKQVVRTAGANREFRVGDAILARDYRTKGSEWAETIVVKKTGPVSYKVDLGNGVEWRRHVDQLIPTKNRYSLPRTRAAPSADSSALKSDTTEVDNGAEDEVFEDASNRDETLNEPLEAVEAPQAQSGQISPAPVPESPSPRTAARALRALKRAKRNISNLE
ncbi:unnamed protein product, partial [Iphiclides podalirius]